MIRRIGLLLALTLIPLTSYAQILITEIMYDLEGSDSKREWIEIFNNGDANVDLLDWRFFDGSNHKLNEPPINGGLGSLVLEASQYAILASDANTFNNEYSLSGNVIDTVMDLQNSEGVISLIDNLGEVNRDVSYSNELGASGNGYSLQLVDGIWIENPPTPLSGAVVSKNVPIAEKHKDQIGRNSIDPYTGPQISANAGGDKIGVVSALMFFEGQAIIGDGDPIQNARYVWNFGDGTRREGKNVAHTYLYPGIYRVSLSVSSGEFVSTDRIVAEVKEAEVEIVQADKGKIEIANKGDHELDLSYWKIKYKDHIYTLPKGTYILENNKAIFPAASTDIVVENLEELVLLYPNGLIASRYLVPLEQHPITKETANEPKIVYKTEIIEKIVEIEVEKEVETSTSAVAEDPNLPASVINNIENEDNGGIYKWLLWLTVVISIAGMIVLAKDKDQNNKELNAKDFRIVDQ